MKHRISRFSAVVLGTCVLFGCASTTQRGVEKQAAQVMVYESDQLRQGQYELVRYLWVGTWRSAFWLPTYSSEAESIASLKAEAARLGANGLINVSCRNQGHSLWSSVRTPSILCNGDAIRVR